MNEFIASSFAHGEPELDSISGLLSWFSISDDDQRRARTLAHLPDELADDIIEAFYDHVAAHPAAASHFDDEAQINRVKVAQKNNFRQLLGSTIDETYIEDRRRIGRIHEAKGIGPMLYVGAYAFYIDRLGAAMIKHFGKDPASAHDMVMQFLKFAHLDIALALETYLEAHTATIQQREREISELPTPVLKLREGLLLIPVVGALDSYRARMLTLQLLEGIREHRAQAVVLDITGVAAVDSAVANHLIQSMTAARLMGAKSVLTGLSAEVAQSLVKIGVTGEALNTSGDLQQGIALAESLMRG